MRTRTSPACLLLFLPHPLSSAGFGSVVEKLHPPSHDIVAFRPAKERTNEEDEAFTGDLRNYDTFLAWVQEKCNPVVR